jgi:predicted Zn-dependent peptidase
MPSNPAVTTMVLVNVGSEFEQSKEGGISHFLEHMMFKGTEKRPRGIDISRELDEVGASYNAFTSKEYTGYHIKSAKVHFAKVTDVLADMVNSSLLREEDMERERGVILEEINMYRDLPQEQVADMFTSILYGDAPAGREVLGTKETVSSFSSRDLAAFRRRHYTPLKTVVVVAGGVSLEKAREVITSLFVTEEDVQISIPKSAQKRKVKKYVPSSPVALKYKKTDQTHFILGSTTCDRYHTDVWALGVLSAVLDGGMSGRIFQRIREELGAAYYASYGSSFYSDHGDWSLSAGVNNTRVHEVLSASLEELRRVRDELVDGKELQKAKDFLLGSLLLSLETSGSRARFYGFQSLFNEDPMYTPDELGKKINAITSLEVKRVAERYFKPENMRLALIGPSKNKKSLENLLTA